MKGPEWGDLSIEKKNGRNWWKHIEYTKPSEFTGTLKRASPLSPSQNKNDTLVAFGGNSTPDVNYLTSQLSVERKDLSIYPVLIVF